MSLKSGDVRPPKKNGRVVKEHAIQAHIIKYLRAREMHSVVASCVGVFSDEAMRRADGTTATLEQLVNPTLLDHSYARGGTTKRQAKGLIGLRRRVRILNAKQTQNSGSKTPGPNSQLMASTSRNNTQQSPAFTQSQVVLHSQSATKRADSDLSEGDDDYCTPAPMTATPARRAAHVEKRRSRSGSNNSHRGITLKTAVDSDLSD